MSPTAIQVENLSKRFELGELAGFRRTLRRLVRGGGGEGRDTFWALRDVGFEVKQGEALGIIGRNGAGKSTLLKILSRITAPTSGYARITGRVGSLLEVGTGFHPELTGRENVFLNGAILGMTRAEIRGKFDQIVDFAGVEKFIDTPVKRYSSGMRVRLAFAVAAHLEPEVLICDEVLAVGDAEFQAKCLGRMSEVAGEGRTVIFVSHNMSAVRRLCQRGVMLVGGKVALDADVDAIVEAYLRGGRVTIGASITFDEDASKPSQFRQIEVTGPRMHGSELQWEEPVRLRFVYEVREVIPQVVLAFYLMNDEGVRVLFSESSEDPRLHRMTLEAGVHELEVEVPAGLLAAGQYVVTAGSSAMGVGSIDNHQACCSFTLVDTVNQRTNRPGIIGTRLRWRSTSGVMAEGAAR